MLQLSKLLHLNVATLLLFLSVSSSYAQQQSGERAVDRAAAARSSWGSRGNTNPEGNTESVGPVGGSGNVPNPNTFQPGQELSPQSISPTGASAQALFALSSINPTLGNVAGVTAGLGLDTIATNQAVLQQIIATVPENKRAAALTYINECMNSGLKVPGIAGKSYSTRLSQCISGPSSPVVTGALPGIVTSVINSLPVAGPSDTCISTQLQNAINRARELKSPNLADQSNIARLEELIADFKCYCGDVCYRFRVGGAGAGGSSKFEYFTIPPLCPVPTALGAIPGGAISSIAGSILPPEVSDIVPGGAIQAAQNGIQGAVTTATNAVTNAAATTVSNVLGGALGSSGIGGAIGGIAGNAAAGAVGSAIGGILGGGSSVPTFNSGPQYTLGQVKAKASYEIALELLKARCECAQVKVNGKTHDVWKTQICQNGSTPNPNLPTVPGAVSAVAQQQQINKGFWGDPNVTAKLLKLQGDGLNFSPLGEAIYLDWEKTPQIGNGGSGIINPGTPGRGVAGFPNAAGEIVSAVTGGNYAAAAGVVYEGVTSGSNPISAVTSGGGNSAQCNFFASNGPNKWESVTAGGATLSEIITLLVNYSYVIGHVRAMEIRAVFEDLFRQLPDVNSTDLGSTIQTMLDRQISLTPTDLEKLKNNIAALIRVITDRVDRFRGSNLTLANNNNGARSAGVGTPQ